MMRRNLRVAALPLALGVSLVALLVVPSDAGAQVDAFRYDLTRVPVGTLYEYAKSNRDGTHEGPISLYVLERDRIESLKWSPDDTTATLVAAELDWERFSVRRFESWALAHGAEPELRATLEADPGGTGVLRIVLRSVSTLSPEGWEAYKRERIRGGP